jgi:hypothetical protein
MCGGIVFISQMISRSLSLQDNWHVTLFNTHLQSPLPIADFSGIRANQFVKDVLVVLLALSSWLNLGSTNPAKHKHTGI